MGNLIGRGQFTLVKLHDGKHMQLILASNLPAIQFFSRQSFEFAPDYRETPIVITPELYFSGSEENVAQYISNPVYTINGKKPIEYGGVVSVESPYTLTINKNMAEVTQLDVAMTCTVTDPDTNLTIQLSAQICYTKQETDNLTPTTILEFPNGNFFKNEIHDFLEANCKLMVGTTDVSGLSQIKWYDIQPGDKYVEIVDNELISGQGTTTLLVHNSCVQDKRSFKCDITYNGVVFTEFATFFKQIDPYILKVENKNGDKMRNGEGVIYCEAHLYRSGVMVPDDEAESKFNFQWKKYNRLSGVNDPTWRNPTTRAIELTKEDIDTLSTFICEVTPKNNVFPYTLPLVLA